MNKTSYIYSLGYKKIQSGYGLILVMAGYNVTRKQFIAAVKEYDEDLDLRKIKIIEELPGVVCDSIVFLQDVADLVNK